MKLEELMADYKNYEVKNKEALLKLLKRPKPKSVYDLEKGDDVWEFYLDGDHGLSTWCNTTYQIGKRDMRNIFLTEEECVKEKTYRQCKTLLERYANGYKWEKDRGNWFLACYYSQNDSRWVVTTYFDVTVMSDQIYFSTVEMAKKAIEEIGEFRILRDYFKIPESDLGKEEFYL